MAINANYISITGRDNYTIDCQLKPGAKLPYRANSTDAGADLFSYEDCEIYPNEQKLVDTGVAIKISQGYGGFIYNRSSQGKNGITIPHSVGGIDSGYRDTIKVLLKNKQSSVFNNLREEFIEDIKRLSPKVEKINYKQKVDKAPLLLELNIFDLHLGKIAWSEETNHEYNLEIAAGH